MIIYIIAKKEGIAMEKNDKLTERLKTIELKVKANVEEQKNLTDNQKKLLALKKISEIAKKA